MPQPVSTRPRNGTPVTYGVAVPGLAGEPERGEQRHQRPADTARRRRAGGRPGRAAARRARRAPGRGPAPATASAGLTGRSPAGSTARAVSPSERADRRSALPRVRNSSSTIASARPISAAATVTANRAPTWPDSSGSAAPVGATSVVTSSSTAALRSSSAPTRTITALRRAITPYTPSPASTPTSSHGTSRCIRHRPRRRVRGSPRRRPPAPRAAAPRAARTAAPSCRTGSLPTVGRRRGWRRARRTSRRRRSATSVPVTSTAVATPVTAASHRTGRGESRSSVPPLRGVGPVGARVSISANSTSTTTAPT